MTSRRLQLLWAAIVITGCDTNWIDPMEIQKKDLPYRRDVFFADQRAMRPLVEGTVAREQILGPREVREGLDAAGRFVTRVPVPLTRPLLNRGRERNDISCATCHGVRGDGHSVVASKMSLRAPPALIWGGAATRPPGEVFRIISLGWGLMAPYSAEISVPDRWAIVAYLQALAISQSAPAGAAP